MTFWIKGLNLCVVLFGSKSVGLEAAILEYLQTREATILELSWKIQVNLKTYTGFTK